jgi:predicted ATPase/DNA-binding SARP family transcriptional activator
VATDLILLSRVSYRDKEITGPRMRNLFALLAGDLRTGCSAARLADELWWDERPENPAKALQILVSRARSQLGADVIANTTSGYRLALTDEQVDTSAVLLSAAAATQRLRDGDHEAALSYAETGLAHWHDATEAEPTDPLSTLRVQRKSTYRALVRIRALALARLGRHDEAVEPLAEVFRDRPKDEEVLLELMRAESPPAALTRYDTYRRRLRDELGTDPGRPLQDFHQRLLQGEAPAVRSGVPHDPNPLLGRDDDLAAVMAMLRSSRVTSIVGPGGLGKTRLAHAVSRAVEQPAVYFVPLAGVTADGAVAAAVASALGVGDAQPVARPAPPPDVVTGISNALGKGPALLVLDNCEHVVRGAAGLVQTLVAMLADLRVLTTSRAPLDISSESVYLLPELDLAASVELFGQRARAARPTVSLPETAVTELCQRLDGLPLAVELAAARVRVMSVVDISARLADRFSLLRGNSRDRPERHRTLGAVIEWSWNLLGIETQRAMRTLSVFPDGFTAQAAEQLLGTDALETLARLTDQSLLKVTDTSAGARFRMLETVREFSSALRDAAETEAVTRQFLDWATGFGVEHHEGPFGPEPGRPVALIRAEQDNLQLALNMALDRGHGPAVAAATAVLADL